MSTNQTLFSNWFLHLQVFWAGPLCGGVVAALLYDFALFPRGSDMAGRLKILCHGAEASDEETEPLLEGGAPAAQWEKP